MKPVLLLAFLGTLLFAEDAREIVRRAVELDTANTNVARNYTFLQRQDVRELDGAGNVKSEKIETWDITLLEGSPYRRLVARNDQPIPAEEQRREEEKLHRSIDDRRQESSTERERRMAEWTRRQERQREPVKELPDAFDFTLTGEEQLGGRPTYVIVGTPKPGYKPKSTLTVFLSKARLRLWIDERDYQGARMEMEVLDTISLGGFLLRVSKGSHLVIEQTRVNNEVWLPKEVSLHAIARLLLVKGLNRDMHFTFSDYKKFQTDSRVVALGEKP
ncbi:MAG TPA: hypothetical protein VLY24_08585 [Bryobacteraceae bacterium]|nr:hypothetical protein [Bryobacteraceae bacterium]